MDEDDFDPLNQRELYLGTFEREEQWVRVMSECQAELAKAKARIKELELGLKDVHALISESRGVAGLHLNGDVAPWDELLPGGRFEEWLSNFGKTAAPGEGGE